MYQFEPFCAILVNRKTCNLRYWTRGNLRYQVSEKTEIPVRRITEKKQSSIESWHLKVIDKLILDTAM